MTFQEQTSLLICPACKSDRIKGANLEGKFICLSCGMHYPIKDGLADFRFVPESFEDRSRIMLEEGYSEQEKWNWWYRKYGSPQLAVERLEKFILDFKKERGSIRLLDIGMFMFGDYCFKAFLEPVRPYIDLYVGVDPSPATFEGRPVEEKMQIYMSYGEYLPLREGVFDIIISIATFDHLFDPDKCLKEIRRVLKPNGYLYIQLNNRGAWWKTFLRRGSKRTYHNFSWNVREFCDLLEAHSFVVQKTICYRYNRLIDQVKYGKKLPYHFHIVLCQFSDVLGRLLLPKSGGNFTVVSSKKA